MHGPCCMQNKILQVTTKYGFCCSVSLFACRNNTLTTADYIKAAAAIRPGREIQMKVGKARVMMTVIIKAPKQTPLGSIDAWGAPNHGACAAQYYCFIFFGEKEKPLQVAKQSLFTAGGRWSINSGEKKKYRWKRTQTITFWRPAAVVPGWATDGSKNPTNPSWDS